MAHTNGHVPDYSHHAVSLKIHTLESELKFFKDLSEQYADELRNIPDAIKQHGSWDCETRIHGKVVLVSREQLESAMKKKAILEDAINKTLKHVAGKQAEGLKKALEQIK